jgi:hypothetical protein
MDSHNCVAGLAIGGTSAGLLKTKGAKQMNEHKSFLHHMAEAYDRYRAERHATASEQTTQSPQAGRLVRALRWFLPNGGTLLLIVALLLTQNVWARPDVRPSVISGPSATTVNYQGRLADPGGNPLDGNYGMSFSLWDAAADGNLVWGPENHAAVPVSEGLFSVGLGSQTSGGIPTNTWSGDRYLEITVGGETLGPRELIRSVPIAGMALTVPDGSVKSDDLDLDHETVCLSGHAYVSLGGNYQKLDVPGLNLDFSLDRPSQVLVWIDGLAQFDDGAFVGESSIILNVDGAEETASWHLTDDNLFFNVKGQRLLNLGSGSHSITVRASSQAAGTMLVHGIEAHRTCINYLVLGEQ